MLEISFSSNYMNLLFVLELKLETALLPSSGCVISLSLRETYNKWLSIIDLVFGTHLKRTKETR